MRVLSDFRRLVAAVEGLAEVLRQIAQMQSDAGPALDRIAALELERHQFEAEIQGTLLKAEGKLKAAANAEARERQLKRSYENQLLDPSVEIGEEGPTLKAVFPGHAGAGEAEGVSPLRLDVAPVDGKTLALRAKFGI